jgi:hypothetical protein
MLIDTSSLSTRFLSFIHRIKLCGNKDFDPSDGHVLPNGSWSGILGMLQRREVDVAYISVTMSSSRLDAVDFAITAVEMRYCHFCR